MSTFIVHWDISLFLIASYFISVREHPECIFGRIRWFEVGNRFHARSANIRAMHNQHTNTCLLLTECRLQPNPLFNTIDDQWLTADVLIDAWASYIRLESRTCELYVSVLVWRNGWSNDAFNNLLSSSQIRLTEIQYYIYYKKIFQNDRWSEKLFGFHLKVTCADFLKQVKLICWILFTILLVSMSKVRPPANPNQVHEWISKYRHKIHMTLDWWRVHSCRVHDKPTKMDSVMSTWATWARSIWNSI